MKTIPSSYHPYAYLARLDKPIGTLLLLHPCIWSTCLYASSTDTPPSIQLITLFTTGAFIMRSAGCTINDMWDSEFDKKVERTKNRPLASNALNFNQALTFLAAQLSLGLGVLLSLPNTEFCCYLGAASLPLVILYPTAKRWTPYPQLLLGLTFNWGALMGYAGGAGEVGLCCLPMYLGGVGWTMVYDTLYAHQDKKDDERIGLKSTALTFGNSKTPLYAFASLFTTGLTLSGSLASMALPYYLGVAAGSGHVFWQIYTADFEDGENLGERFKSNQIVGGVVSAGAVAACLI
ncbi:hypothetical protein TL16_g04592 [Triparma laevis f. inornata]|uniref:4-hydroxybenzoate polyprenyltransferase, mitochondrial n=2 Tax=Triparma laevis TaxID=1534972 RepID=A0A9W7AUB1_9STRA|nr:hypothetical protein TL16_g04592 [Triparma laevis f. inornata]GMH79206.1 hypothetical protein TrLO_g13602 [Triparma laevis f. longispina]